jgi:hypothetical protein
MRQGNCKLRNSTLEHSADGYRSLQQTSSDGESQKEQSHGLYFAGQDSGSIILLQPLTREARNWAEEHLSEDAQYFGDSIAIERRFFADILRGLTNDRLSFAWSGVK